MRLARELDSALVLSLFFSFDKRSRFISRGRALRLGRARQCFAPASARATSRRRSRLVLTGFGENNQRPRIAHSGSSPFTRIKKRVATLERRVWATPFFSERKTLCHFNALSTVHLYTPLSDTPVLKSLGTWCAIVQRIQCICTPLSGTRTRASQ